MQARAAEVEVVRIRGGPAGSPDPAGNPAEDTLPAADTLEAAVDMDMLTLAVKTTDTTAGQRVAAVRAGRKAPESTLALPAEDKPEPAAAQPQE